MKAIKVSVDGLTWRKPGGRYIDEIWYSEAINRIISYDPDKTVLKTFIAINKHVFEGTIDTLRSTAYKLLDRLKQLVEDMLEEAGWEVHIIDPLKSSETKDYIHNATYGLMVHEVPFSAETNINLRLDELCDITGQIRPKEKTLALLKERIGVDAFDIRELSEDQREYIIAIFEVEGLDLEYLHDVDGQELTTGAESFRWFRNDEEAEREARDYLTDEPVLWQMAVAAGDTTEGLSEWVEERLGLDGWAQILCGYDGIERIAQVKGRNWFSYIRTD